MRAKSRKLTLGIDIDNVIAKTDKKIREIIRNTYGIDLTQEDITVYNYHKCGISRQQERDVLNIFHKKECKDVELVRGAKSSLSILGESYKVIIVTSRDLSSRKATEHWLKAKAIRYGSLIFENRKHKTGVKFHYFIEDCWKHALKLAKAGTKVLLFNYPWNLSRPEHPNIRRVNNWKEILMLISGT